MQNIFFDDVTLQYSIVCQALFSSDPSQMHLYETQRKHSYAEHWRSKETYLFFIATLNSKAFKMTHNWAQISYSTPYQSYLKQQTFAWVKNGVKCSEIATGNM